MLLSSLTPDLIEAGCDEAGRGCLAGPVFAASVILPKNYKNEYLNDSKKLSEKQRYYLREEIEKNATAFAIAAVDNKKIDEINILNASILAMHLAVDNLCIKPDILLIDGNRFKPYQGIIHKCIVKGDAKILSIAAASILAKTYRDDFMKEAHNKYPMYAWNKNKAYATKAHYQALQLYGSCELHRKSFRLI